MYKIINFTNKPIAINNKNFKIIAHSEAKSDDYYDAIVHANESQNQFLEFQEKSHQANIYTILINENQIEKIEDILLSKIEVFELKREIYKKDLYIEKSKILLNFNNESIDMVNSLMTKSTQQISHNLSHKSQELKSLSNILESKDTYTKDEINRVIFALNNFRLQILEYIPALQCEDIIIQINSGVKKIVINSDFDDTTTSKLPDIEKEAFLELILKNLTIQKQRDLILGKDISESNEEDFEYGNVTIF